MKLKHFGMLAVFVAALFAVELVPHSASATTLPPQAHTILRPLNGTPVYLGTIDVTITSKTNSQAATAFSTAEDALEGKVLLIQCDAATFIGPAKTSSGTVTTANGVKLTTDERVIITMAQGYHYLAAIVSAGTANCKFWELV
jgi:hypothetical protein